MTIESCSGGYQNNKCNKMWFVLNTIIYYNDKYSEINCVVPQNCLAIYETVHKSIEQFVFLKVSKNLLWQTSVRLWNHIELVREVVRNCISANF